VVLVLLAGDAQHWVVMPFAERILRCGGGIAAGAAVYFAALWLLGLRYRDLRTQVI
jgi:peptidoglycan biosynthesis protein MviN/MurJ (putative lipid II flippase)